MKRKKRETRSKDAKIEANKFSGNLLSNEPLTSHTTWGIGGPARFFLEAKTLEDVNKALGLARRGEMPWYVIGNGSNLLIPDEGFPGMVIKPGKTPGKIYMGKSSIWASAGEHLTDLVRTCNRYGISCFNFLAGIPATVGGAIATNAGACGFSIGRLVKKVYYMDNSNRLKSKSAENCGFCYRESEFKTSSEIILGVEFQPNENFDLPDMETIIEKRKEKLPRMPSPGCIFKNPKKLDVSAGELIDHAGCKGLSFGDAKISEKHANFIINKGHAKKVQVEKLIDKVRKRVLKKFGVSLTPEIEVMPPPNTI